MARRPRLSIADIPQHVVQRGNNRQAIFHAVADYRNYLGTLARVAAARGCAIHAYVLMTNHVHLLVTPRSSDALSSMMRDLGRRYVQQYFNATYARTGTLWEGRYKSVLVDARHYFFACCRYIELNPVRAGIVEHPRDYRWSSFRHNALGSAEALLSPHPEYIALGAGHLERQRAYRSLFDEDVAALDLEQIRKTVNGGWPLGSELFKDGIEEALKRRARPAKRGRRAVSAQLRT